jgi:hypothetical protein
MRSVQGAALVYLLVVLLTVTTPVGAGQGVHRDQLVDLIIPHTHYDRPIPTGPLRPITHDASAKPNLGAGDGADAAGPGLAVTPTVPSGTRALQPYVPPRRLQTERELPLPDWLEAPPDPPPTSA